MGPSSLRRLRRTVAVAVEVGEAAARRRPPRPAAGARGPPPPLGWRCPDAPATAGVRRADAAPAARNEAAADRRVVDLQRAQPSAVRLAAAREGSPPVCEHLSQ